MTISLRTISPPPFHLSGGPHLVICPLVPTQHTRRYPRHQGPVIFCLHLETSLNLGEKFVRISEEDAGFADRPVTKVEAHFKLNTQDRILSLTNDFHTFTLSHNVAFLVIDSLGNGFSVATSNCNECMTSESGRWFL